MSMVGTDELMDTRIGRTKVYVAWTPKLVPVTTTPGELFVAAVVDVCPSTSFTNPGTVTFTTMLYGGPITKSWATAPLSMRVFDGVALVYYRGRRAGPVLGGRR